MEVGTVTTATPSPRGAPVIRTPPAPLHGFSDTYEPYSPRKSSRIKARNANRTPSPSRNLSDEIANSNSVGSAKSDFHRTTTNMTSPGSVLPKKRAPAAASSGRATSAVNVHLTTSSATMSGNPSGKNEFYPGRASISAIGGMLITPAKTPQKPPTKETRAKIHAVARSLFSESETVPTPRKARGHESLDTLTGESQEQTIQIYTDSNERIPEVDKSEMNPFYRNGSVATNSASHSETIEIPGEGKVSIDEAVRREDGIVYTFRGKKSFRKFAEGGLAPEQQAQPRLGRPLTRSFVKPRLLFPAPEAPKTVEPEIAVDEEEATTDIEDNATSQLVENTPIASMDVFAPGTPMTVKAAKYTPASPPTTQRTTRFGTKKSGEASPVKDKKSGGTTPISDEVKETAKGGSPFDSWRRLKGAPEASSQKRQGGPLATGPHKRARSS